MIEPVESNFSIEGNGLPLFLVHGIGGAIDVWRFLIPKLSKIFTVISYDLRGHGKTSITKNKFNLDDLVEDLEYLRKKLGFKKIYIAGHSLGGMIAPAYAIKYVKNVFAIALISTAAGRNAEDRSRVINIIKLIKQNGITKIANTLIDRWFTDEFIQLNPDIIQKRIQQVIDTDLEIILNVFHIYANTEMFPWLKNVSVPSLVLTGEKDGGCSPRLNKIIANQIPDSKLVILQKYKHSLLLEAPDEVADNIISFIKDLSL